jgi:predicted outer membrane protein
MLAAAGLLLVACRTNGERGEAGPQERVVATGRPAQVERPVVGATEETGTARLLAAVKAMTQAEVDAGKLAQQRASSHDVKDYATRLVAEYQANIDALADLTKAKKIDLDATVVQNDPVLKAHRAAAKEGIDRLRSLSGTAFDASYMTTQRPSQVLLQHLAQELPQASRDTDVENVLRTVAQQARDRAGKVLTILPKACGGDRAGWGGAG